MTNKEYHGHKAIGSTMLSTLLLNAKKFKMIRDGELEIKTRAMDIGSALHKIVLEPQDFENEFIVGDFKIPTKIKELVENDEDVEVYPDEVLTPSGALSTSKKAKELLEKLEDKIYLTQNEKKAYDFYKENKDKIILTLEDMEEVEKLRDKILTLPKLKKWIELGVAEKSFFGEIDGVEVKCRPDLLVKTKEGYIVIDLKTMGGEATPETFAKSSGNFLYPLQEALYKEVLRQNGIDVIDFVFAGVSKLEYSGAGYFRHDIQAIQYGEDLLKKAIFKYKWCEKHNIWEEGNFDFLNGGFSVINDVILPNYVYYKF